MGLIGRYEAADHHVYTRGTEVVCRTQRGLEVGTVLCQFEQPTGLSVSGKLLRPVGPEDRLIIDRLERFRDRAFLACQEKLAEVNLKAILVDVEHLFDGESLYFYFLGDSNDKLESITEELAATYDRKVKFKRFAETLAQGCGPGCGTTASACGSQNGCASCGISGGCRSVVTH